MGNKHFNKLTSSLLFLFCLFLLPALACGSETPASVGEVEQGTDSAPVATEEESIIEDNSSNEFSEATPSSDQADIDAAIVMTPTTPAIRAATAIVLTLEAAPTNTQSPTEIPPTATNPPSPTATQQIVATSIPPTAVPPTAVPPTSVPPTEMSPQPTEPLPSGNGLLEIIGVNKSAEYVDIRNNDVAPVDLAGWVLRSEKGSQDCPLGGIIQPGQTLRIWAMSADAGQGGFNCGFDSNIWNNSESDPAVLINPSGQEVSRR